VNEHEEPYDGRLSQPVPILHRDTVPWERRGAIPLRDSTGGNWRVQQLK
jgi:hypothetical protein